MNLKRLVFGLAALVALAASISFSGIARSADGGAIWQPLASGLPDDTTFSWTPPRGTVRDARVRVSVHDAKGESASDESDGGFAILSLPRVTSARFVVSTTSVFPSQWPRASPSHWRTFAFRWGRPSIGMMRTS